MDRFSIVKGFVAVMVVLLEMSSGTTAAWATPYTSSFQPVWQKTPFIGQGLRYGYGYSSYQPAQSILRQTYTSVQGNQYPTYNPGYGQVQVAPSSQTLQYQGYKAEPAPSPVVAAPLALSCPSCPSPVPAASCPAPTPTPACPAPSCPASVPASPCPAPVPAPPCPVLSCPGPAPAPPCPAPTPAPACPAPTPAPACPAPVPAPACPAPVPAPVCPAPVPAPPVVLPLTDIEKSIMDFQNWECVTIYDSNTKPISSCVVIGPTASATAGTAQCPNWVLPVFCDNAVNEIAKAMSALMPAPPPPTVPPGYTFVDNQGYFWVNTDLLNFADATAACAADGAILAVPQNPDDYPPLFTMVKAAKVFGSGFFIGFTDEHVSDVFEYPVTNQPVCTTGLYRHQAAYKGLPNENCTTIGFGFLPDLQDVPCSWLLPSLCQVMLPSRYPPAPCA